MKSWRSNVVGVELGLDESREADRGVDDDGGGD